MTRGVDARGIPTSIVEADTRWLTLALPDLSDRSPVAEARVHMVAPEGDTLATLTASVAKLSRSNGAIVFDAAGRDLLAGTYRLVVVLSGPRVASDTLQYPFRVAHRPSR